MRRIACIVCGNRDSGRLEVTDACVTCLARIRPADYDGVPQAEDIGRDGLMVCGATWAARDVDLIDVPRLTRADVEILRGCVVPSRVANVAAAEALVNRGFLSATRQSARSVPVYTTTGHGEDALAKHHASLRDDGL
jgi:hypothetical protein